MIYYYWDIKIVKVHLLATFFLNLFKLYCVSGFGDLNWSEAFSFSWWKVEKSPFFVSLFFMGLSDYLFDAGPGYLELILEDAFPRDAPTSYLTVVKLLILLEFLIRFVFF